MKGNYYYYAIIIVSLPLPAVRMPVYLSPSCCFVRAAALYIYVLPEYQYVRLRGITLNRTYGRHKKLPGIDLPIFTITRDHS